jgi:hypothetical protein
MAQVKVQHSLASPTLNLASAAVITALLAGGPPTFAEQYPKVLAKNPVKWEEPDAAHPTFQQVSVEHGTTSTTKTVVAVDPWDELERLDADWDGNGAAPISISALRNARRFATSEQTFGNSFHPFADPDGSVGLEATKPGKVAYLIVSDSDRFSYVLRQGDTVHRGDNVDALKMREILALLY